MLTYLGEQYNKGDTENHYNQQIYGRKYIRKIYIYRRNELFKNF